jgi:CHAT domain-containing protein
LTSYQRYLQEKYADETFLHWVQQEKKQRQYLHFLNLQLIACENNLTRDEKKEEKLREKIRTGNFVLDSLELFVKEKYPNNTGPSIEHIPVFIQEIKKHLGSDEVLLEYSVSDRELFVFLITETDFVFYTASLDSRFERNLQNLVKLLQSPAEINYRRYLFLKDQCYFLYTFLIKPFYNEIENKKLIIIPDELLLELPFEVLLTENKYSQRIDFQDLSYLILEHAVSYNYSAHLFVKTKEKDENSAQVNLLCFAPFASLSDNDQHKKELLPGTLREVNALKNILKTELYIDTLASESVFKSMCNRRSIFHVATHGVVHQKSPLYSHLLFHPDNRHEDGFLHVYELLDMHMEAPFVVLSACKSASSSKSREIGLTGLSTAFIHAGVPGLLTTLWNISDEASSEIIIRFYKHLSRGLPKDEALRMAKIDYLYNADNFSAHPYFWAGYINIGSAQALDLEKKKHIALKVIFFSVLFIFLFIIFKKISRAFLFSDNN